MELLKGVIWILIGIGIVWSGITLAISMIATKPVPTPTTNVAFANKHTKTEIHHHVIAIPAKKILYRTRAGAWLTAKALGDGYVNRKGYKFQPKLIASRNAAEYRTLTLA